MNITEYIVAHLKQGHNVELPGIGTFAVRHIDVHYDSASGTLFPAQQTLTFEPRNNGDNSIVQYIADQECISMATAQQMFKNYLDALREKLDVEHRHTFNGIGTITKDGSMCSFEADPQQSLTTDDKLRVPLSNVKRYNSPYYDDPFARFSQPFLQEDNSAAPKETPDSIQPAAPQPQPSIVKPAEVETTFPKEATGSISSDAATLKEKLVTPIAGATERPIGQPEPADQSWPVSSDHKDNEALAVDVQSARNLEERATEVPPYTASQDTQNEKEAAQEVRQPQPDALASLQAMEKLSQQKASTEKQEDANAKTRYTDNGKEAQPKKKHTGLVVILILLILIVLGGAAYYYFKIYRPDHQPATSNLKIEEMVTGSEGVGEFEPAGIAGLSSTGETVADEPGVVTMEETEAENNTSDNAGKITSDAADASAATSRVTGISAAYAVNNDFTQASDAIIYDSEDILSLTRDIYSYLRPYIISYLQSRHYSRAEEAMQQKVLVFTQNRLTEMMQTNGFHVQDFFNYCSHDYQHSYLEKDLKVHHAARQRVVMQRELMNIATLGHLLDEVLQNNEIPADPHQTMVQPRQKQKVSTAVARETTKKGFDVIAGFYVNRASADKMASSLKKKGCDAYIINRDGLYYVSMGSAGSQTEAEHLYHHIKEWYKGDVAIKKW